MSDDSSILSVLGGGSRFTIARLMGVVRSRRLTFVVTTLLVTTAVVARAYLATPVYRVTMQIIPRQEDGSASALQSLVGQFSGIASMAGLAVGIGAPLDEQEALAWLKSRALAERFIQEANLLPILFEKAWDAESGRWKSTVQSPPTLDDAWEAFSRLRRVEQEPRTRIITLQMSWTDRHLAAAWANALVAKANEELRARALREADASLESLQAQLEETDSVGLRQSIFRLMEAQLHRKVLAKARSDYAFAIIDPAVVPDAERFASPRRKLLIAVAIPLGLFAGSCMVLAMQLAAELLAIRKRE